MSTGVLVTTAVLWVVLILAAMGVLVVSLLYRLASDGCAAVCDSTPVTWAYVVTWGGLALAFGLAVTGSVWRATRGVGRPVWPLLGLGVVASTATVGLELVASV